MKKEQKAQLWLRGDKWYVIYYTGGTYDEKTGRYTGGTRHMVSTGYEKRDEMLAKGVLKKHEREMMAPASVEGGARAELDAIIHEKGLGAVIGAAKGELVRADGKTLKPITTGKGLEAFFMHYKPQVTKETYDSNFSRLTDLAKGIEEQPLTVLDKAYAQAYIDRRLTEGEKWKVMTKRERRKTGVRRFGPNGAKHLRVTLSRLLGWAVDGGYVAKNYAGGLKVGKVIRPEIDVLSLGEIDRLLASLKDDDRMRAAIGVLCYTGLRRKELLNLRWRDIEGGLIWVRHQKIDGSVAPTKTGKERAVPINRDLRPILDAWRATRPNLVHLAGRLATAAG